VTDILKVIVWIRVGSYWLSGAASSSSADLFNFLREKKKGPVRLIVE